MASGFLERDLRHNEQENVKGIQSVLGGRKHLRHPFTFIEDLEQNISLGLSRSFSQFIIIEIKHGTQNHQEVTHKNLYPNMSMMESTLDIQTPLGRRCLKP